MEIALILCAIAELALGAVERIEVHRLPFVQPVGGVPTDAGPSAVGSGGRAGRLGGLRVWVYRRHLG